MKRIHYIAGVTITIFIILHLYNHIYSLFGVDAHIELMDQLRTIYRNVIAESILMMAVLVQIFSGIQLFRKKQKQASGFFDYLQIWSGLYLAIFFLFHLSAVFAGRFLLELDTNIYFGVAGLNSFPFNLFFIPYYGLAIISFFGHIAVIHYNKMKSKILGVSPRIQSIFILGLGVVLTIIILYGLTNGFNGMEIPTAYHILIGK